MAIEDQYVACEAGQRIMRLRHGMACTQLLLLHCDDGAAAFDRLVNKLLHPPLESLRDESRHGPPHGLLDALKRLFQLED